MQKQFVIPINKEDLLTATVSDQYVIQETYRPQDIPKKIQEGLRAISASSIFDLFDAFYAAVNNVSSLSEFDLQDIWKCVLKCSNAVKNELGNFFANDHVDERDRKQLLCITKMTIYSLCTLMEAIDSETAKASAEANIVKMKGRKKGPAPNARFVNWSVSRKMGVDLLQRISEYPLHSLWKPEPFVDENFVILITNCLYRLLENPEIAKESALLHDIFHILAIYVEKHAHGLGCVVKITQLLLYFDHIAPVLADGISLFVQDHNLRSFIRELLCEIDKMDNELVNADNQGTRTTSTFLLELSRRLPDEILKNVSYLSEYLASDAAPMRCAILTIFGELVASKLSEENIEDRQRKLRDDLLDTLEDHIHDVNAFARCKALQAWQMLCEEKKVPLSRHEALLEHVCGRLMDTSALVRKSAMHTLSAYISCNPFCAQLTASTIRENLDKEKAKLKALLANFNGASSTPSSTEEEESEVGESPMETDDKDGGDDSESNAGGEGKERKSNGERERRQQFTELDEMELKKQETLVSYLTDTLNFATMIQTNLPVIAQLLQSKVQTDVLEAITFFVTAKEFGVAGAEIGIRQMASLIGSDEPTIRDAALSGYKKLYLNKQSDIADNLCHLMSGASLSDVNSLKVLVSQLMANGEMNSNILSAIWRKFSSDNIALSCSAAYLLSMAASCEPRIVASNLNMIVSDGIERKPYDYVRVRTSCLLLSHLPVEKDKQNCRLLPDHNVPTALKNVLLYAFDDLATDQWCPMMDRAIEVIYKLCEEPDIIATDIIRGLIHPLFKAPDSDEICAHPLKMARFVATIGCVAFRQMVHMDSAILDERKKRTEAKAEKKGAEKGRDGGGKGKRSSRRSVLNVSTASKSGRGAANDTTTTEEEMGLCGAVADDADLDLIVHLLENELLDPQNLLGLAAQFIAFIVRHPETYSDQVLQTHASLALVKCMLLSSKFFNDHAALIFTIMERCQSDVIRANITVTMADLARRFPNEFEPWTPKLYAIIGDKNVVVRKNIVRVLSYLILHDLIKVKGQVSDLAQCLVDPDETIANMTRLFFRELAQKGNALYNVLPDIISRLSDTDIGIKEDDFQKIMQYLFSLIEKDRQLEHFVEKLCLRFRSSTAPRQHRDLAFCLSQLHYNDRSLRRLHDHIACYGDKLEDDTIYNCFTTIIKKASTAMSRQGAKVLLEEYETAVEEYRNKGVCENKLADRAKTAASKKSTASRKGVSGNDATSTPRLRRGRPPARSALSSDDDDADDLVDDAENDKLAGNRADSKPKVPPVPKDTPIRTSSRRKAATRVLDSDDDQAHSDSEEVIVPRSSRRRR